MAHPVTDDEFGEGRAMFQPQILDGGSIAQDRAGPGKAPIAASHAPVPRIRDVAPALPADGDSDAPRLQLINRRKERQSLRDLLDRVQAGFGGVLVLRGEPGIGKSALLEDAVESAPDM